MHQRFEIISFLNEALESRQSGRVYIDGPDVKWCLDITEGKLLFAAHSLQYLNTLETILPSLGYEALLPIYWRLTQLKVYKRQVGTSALDALNWTSKIVGALIQYNALEVEKAEKILAKLAEDAVESLLGLENATVAWHPFPKELWHTTTQGIEIASLVNHLTRRLQAWQPLSDRICSPHQRPYCENLEDLFKPTLQGGLSRQMLESLARLMQGASIRQLAQSIKQEETKLAQLLYPYIEHQAIKLWPPLSPLDRLPWLPTEQKSPELVTSTAGKQSEAAVVNKSSHPVANGAVLGKTATTSELNSNNGSKQNYLDNNGSTVLKSKYLIICIDDSKAMLEKIESYLDPDYFELKTIMDPVKAISKICTKKPSLVLMDISMPTISGNSLCSILKRSYMFKDVPIIMISSNTGALNKAKAEVSGAAGYLEKPFSKVQLMNLLDTHLKLNMNRFE
ncbi:response regulator [Leptolyngbya cf. ectocarpi LEGE 11479]|uniref:Response regulator n=1 Tax=Leptolyngbya cf. ectocarpi LEGE 11479 TaxID=1828722 RepID=A0A929F713_LEPEC|nr:response regulator [Leptolyngbya ectocarpi]MBE9068495.1 response regulator [Leptolyngbya cf. ectocarpi LEGE 11479]